MVVVVAAVALKVAVVVAVALKVVHRRIIFIYLVT
jgi:hypothetical protein